MVEGFWKQIIGNPSKQGDDSDSEKISELISN